MAGGAQPGRGGIDRGRGDAAMIWGDESPGGSDRFEAKALPKARLSDPESSAILGIGSAAPTVDARGEGAGLVETSATSGKIAWRRRLSPRHRRAVGSFFGQTTRERKE